MKYICVCPAEHWRDRPDAGLTEPGQCLDPRICVTGNHKEALLTVAEQKPKRMKHSGEEV